MRTGIRASIAFWLLLLWPASVLAHTRGGEAIGFVSGVQHPVSGLDHVLAMIAVLFMLCDRAPGDPGIPNFLHPQFTYRVIKIP